MASVHVLFWIVIPFFAPHLIVVKQSFFYCDVAVVYIDCFYPPLLRSDLRAVLFQSDVLISVSTIFPDIR